MPERLRGRAYPIASVVVTAQGDAATLGQCLDAIANQQCDLPYEVIVVDAFSEDESAEIALRHPAVTRVGVSPRPDRREAHTKGAALANARVVALTEGAFAPAPDWLDRGLQRVLEGADIVKGSWPSAGASGGADPPASAANMFLDRRVLDQVGLFVGGQADPEEDLCRRARRAGFDITTEPEARVVPISPSTPVTPPPSPMQKYAARGPGAEATSAPAAMVSVVLCTAGKRPERLEGCLRSLADVDDDNYELLVVDNGRVPTVSQKLVEEARGRLVHERARGLDRARNRGIDEASGDIVAFVDDDCEVTPTWVTEIRRPFADGEVALATGRVVPATLAHESQRWFEYLCSFDRGPIAFRFTPDDLRAWYPLFPSVLGTGCNMAFRRVALDKVGRFDEALDMGSLIGGGGDLDIFARFLDAGFVGEYAPEAVVLHHHRASQRGLERQFWDYGTAQGALCFKSAVWRPHLRRVAIRHFVSLLWDRRCRLRQVRKGMDTLPPPVLRREILGMVCGPILYLWSRARVRRV